MESENDIKITLLGRGLAKVGGKGGVPGSVGLAQIKSVGVSCHFTVAARLCSATLDGAAILLQLDDNESD